MNSRPPERPIREILDDDDGWVTIVPGGVPARARDQVSEALSKLRRAADSYLRWPFPELDALTRPLGAGGKVWIVCAFSGSGKTTFVTSCIDLWRRLGKRIYAMPLETQADEFRTYLACLECGVYPGDVLSGALHTAPDGAEQFARVASALERQTERPYVDQVMVSDLSAINLKGLEKGLKEAQAFQADIVIIDHIDHVEGGDGSHPAADSRRVCHAALEFAKRNGLTILFTSQLNLDGARGRDRLTKYAPPRVEHLWLPGVKLQVAAGIIGLHRKLRDQRPTESNEDYAAAVKAAKDGRIPPSEVLDHHAMGVNAMKLRMYGRNEGQWTYLGFERGRVTPMAEKDRYVTGGFGQPRRVV